MQQLTSSFLFFLSYLDFFKRLTRSIIILVKGKTLAALLLTISSSVMASTYPNVHKVMVFTNNTIDLAIPESLFDSGVVHIHNLDKFSYAEARLNRLVEVQAKSMTTPMIFSRMTDTQLISLYTKAFQKVNQSDQFNGIISALKAGSESHMHMMQYNIQALPAIVVNDLSVIYGHSNIHDAISLHITAGQQ